jgi:hypothetical protein
VIKRANFANDSQGADSWLLVSKKRIFSAFMAILILGGCTAGTRSAVLARFPDIITVEDFIFFVTNLRSCTFAEVLIEESVTIDRSLTEASRRALDAVEPQTPIRRLEFPDEGFLYFSGLSAAELAALIRQKGDLDLAWDVEELIFFRSKECWRRRLSSSSQEYVRYKDLISDREVIIVISADVPNTVILLKLDDGRAFYFGP